MVFGRLGLGFIVEFVFFRNIIYGIDVVRRDVLGVVGVRREVRVFFILIFAFYRFYVIYFKFL